MKPFLLVFIYLSGLFIFATIPEENLANDEKPEIINPSSIEDFI